MAEKTEKKTIPQVMLEILNNVNKAYDAPVMSIADEIKLIKIRTGIFAIDYATLGGIPRGRWLLVVGNESSFKSTLTYMIGASFQRICGSCLTGMLEEKNFAGVNVILDSKSNAYVTATKKGDKVEYRSKGLLANSKKKNIYVPNQLLSHTKSFKAYTYSLECSECESPDYSIFFLIDSEHNYTQYWSIKCNVVHGRVILAQPSYTEQIGDMCKEALGTGVVSFVGVDSVPALGPLIEDTSSMEDQQMGVQPRAWNKIVRVLTAMLNKSFTYIYVDKNKKQITKVMKPEPALGMIQQWREKIGGYGNPQTMTAGRGLRYASSITMEFAVDEIEYNGEKKDKNIKGIWFRFILAKAKTAKQMSNGRLYFNLSTYEVENERSIVETAISTGLIKQTGAWFEVGKARFQGKEKLIEGLKGKWEAIGDKLVEKAIASENPEK